MRSRVYAYGVFVAGRKRYGGTIRADTMDQAAIHAAKICKLKMRYYENNLLQDVDWTLDGKRASIYVWAPPEYFTNCGIEKDTSFSPDATVEGGRDDF